MGKGRLTAVVTLSDVSRVPAVLFPAVLFPAGLPLSISRSNWSSAQSSSSPKGDKAGEACCMASSLTPVGAAASMFAEVFAPNTMYCCEVAGAEPKWPKTFAGGVNWKPCGEGFCAFWTGTGAANKFDNKDLPFPGFRLRGGSFLSSLMSTSPATVDSGGVNIAGWSHGAGTPAHD